MHIVFKTIDIYHDNSGLLTLYQQNAFLRQRSNFLCERRHQSWLAASPPSRCHSRVLCTRPLVSFKGNISIDWALVSAFTVILSQWNPETMLKTPQQRKRHHACFKLICLKVIRQKQIYRKIPNKRYAELWARHWLPPPPPVCTFVEKVRLSFSSPLPSKKRLSLSNTCECALVVRLHCRNPIELKTKQMGDHPMFSLLLSALSLAPRTRRGTRPFRIIRNAGVLLRSQDSHQKAGIDFFSMWSAWHGSAYQKKSWYLTMSQFTTVRGPLNSWFTVLRGFIAGISWSMEDRILSLCRSVGH